MTKRRCILLGGFSIVVLAAFWLWNTGQYVYEVDQPITADPSDCQADFRFAVIGDFGDAGQPEADVSGWYQYQLL